MGSGLIVSVAYMDPGNWGTNISGGAAFNYDLIWVIWLASGMAMLFQYLSGKLGLAGYSLAELVIKKIKKRWMQITYWLLAEIAVLATDLAEFLGIVVALNLLFKIPMLEGSFIAFFDVLLLLVFSEKRFRWLEKAFVGFVGIIGLAFLYEVIITKPDLNLILVHSIKPILTKESALIAVGIIGATVMPHALFIHSWLTKRKTKEFKNKKENLKYHTFDTVASLTIAALINAAMLIMAAAAFFHSGETIVTIEHAYYTLIPAFGNFAAIAFGVALLSAGISSSITGTLSGQAVMESLSGFKINIVVRRLITRFINLIPLVIVILLNINPLNVLLYSQVLLSILLPLPLIPLILFTSDKKIMKELVNKKLTIITAWVFGAVILFFNIYLLYSELIKL